MAEQPGIELQRVEPLLFGRVRPFWLLSSGALLLLVAIALLALADWVPASVLLLLALLVLGLYLVAARHLPPSRLARGALGGVWRGRDELRFTATYARAWTRAGWRVACVERERRRLRRERDAAQFELGGAAYRNDESDAARLHERMMELDEEIAACGRRIDESRQAARERIVLARAPLRPTEISPPTGGQTRAPARREG